MFRKFSKSDVSTSTQVKSSVQRAIKSQLLEQHPGLTEEVLDELLPKKHPLVQYKVGPHLMLYCVSIMTWCVLIGLYGWQQDRLVSARLLLTTSLLFPLMHHPHHSIYSAYTVYIYIYSTEAHCV